MGSQQNEKMLQEKHDTMLLTVNKVAKKLLSHTAGQAFDDIVRDCLRLLGERLGQNRVYIWQDITNAQGQLCCAQVYEWAKGIHPIQGDVAFENVPYAALPSFQAALDKGQCLNQMICDLTSSEKEILGPQGIQTLLVAPIIIDNLRWGFIGVDNCESMKLFTQYEENMLLTSGFMLASAILKQATETTLRQSEELVQAMFDATPLACSVWNSNFELLLCNEGGVRLFGVENKQAFLDNFHLLSPTVQPGGQNSYDLAMEYIGHAFRTGHHEFEWLHKKMDGEYMPVQVTLERITYKNETAVAAYVRDQRELKVQEEKRRLAEDRTQLMFNAMPLCCNFWDKNFHNVACNDEAVRLFALQNQEDYIQHFTELSPERQPCGTLSAELSHQKITQAFIEGYARFEWMHQRLDGTPIPAEVTLIRLEFKNEYFVVGYTRDLRAYKTMLAEIEATQQELALARDEALAHSNAKSEFLANMSHEIRTPMNGILGLSYLALQCPEMDPQLRDYISKIDESAKNLLRIINDILDFSKIAAGKLEIEHLPFDLTETLEQLIQPLIPLITDKGLEILFDFARDIPTRLVGDAVRLRQVILNLLSNAIKFTHHGSIVIRIESLSQSTSSTVLRFTVSDTGVGIAPQYLNSLFEAFTQADSSVTRRYGGTGLGLAICKQIITLMDGEISASSTVGVGSTFTFSAKFGIAAQADVQRRALHDMDGKSVLIVDDNEISRRILTEYIQNFGATTDCAKDGQAALALLAERTAQNKAYYAVVLDWKMPGMSGLELAAGIQDITGDTTPPIVMVTAYEREALAFDAQNVGIGAVLTKPVTPSSLHDSLRKAVLEKEKAGGDCAPAGAGRQSTGVPGPTGSTGSTGSTGPTGANGRAVVSQAKPLYGKKVLLAEDNEINQLIAGELLSSYGVIVSVAATGREAVELALSEHFDAILMDIQMPEMDGIEATKILREQHTALNAVPIIAMTAHAMAGDHEKSIMAGMQAHITKPIDPQELYTTLLHWMHESSNV